MGIIEDILSGQRVHKKAVIEAIRNAKEGDRCN
jgi:hypothetical protein